MFLFTGQFCTKNIPLLVSFFINFFFKHPKNQHKFTYSFKRLRITDVVEKSEEKYVSKTMTIKVKQIQRNSSSIF